MIRPLLYLLIGLATSFFLFPFNLPGLETEVNTKMILAVIGAVWFLVDIPQKKKGFVISRGFFVLSLICVLISVWAFGVTVHNQTSDYAFARYIISVWVWLGAAYAAVRMMKAVHGDVSAEIIANYLIGVCVVQCLLAYSMNLFPNWGDWVDSLMAQEKDLTRILENRMHGLGASLDPAGLRFSAVLVICAYLAAKTDFDTKPWTGFLYLIAFIIISVIGNIIARSTTVGMLLAPLLFILLRWPRKGQMGRGRSWSIIGGGLVVTILLATWLYRTDPGFRENLRFGFEGFFSLVEKGRWEVRSNEILKGMIVWPETLKTWAFGDGFFENPQDIPDRFGQIRSGFYMQTDIGYLRYIFYFGLVGLVGMVAVFAQMTITCIKYLEGHKWLFLMLFLVNLIGWVKVSSDIIMVFAPFLILAYQKERSCTSSTT